MNTLDLQREDQALLDSLHALDRACGPYTKKHDRAIVLIHACIDAGQNTHGRIISIMHAIGWNLKHAQIILSKSAGSNPALHRWQRDEAGVYHNHL